MEFDLRTCDSAFNFIINFMNMTPNEYIMEFIVESNKNYETFWDRNIDRIKEADISDLKIMAVHVLGSLDECKEIKEKGLMNLQKVLDSRTKLSILLKKHGFEFNVLDKTMKCKGKMYDINYEHYKSRDCLINVDKVLDNVAHRIYYDFCVCGFLSNDDIPGYGTQIHKRPEFLMRLAEFFSDAEEIELYWKRNSKSYCINFYTMVEQIHRFTFELDVLRDPPYKGWLELNDEMKIKKWILANAIERSENKFSEQYLYVRDDVIIPPNQIVSIQRYKT